MFFKLQQQSYVLVWACLPGPVPGHVIQHLSLQPGVSRCGHYHICAGVMTCLSCSDIFWRRADPGALCLGPVCSLVVPLDCWGFHQHTSHMHYCLCHNSCCACADAVPLCLALSCCSGCDDHH
jgi:hypothetical protein